MTSNQHGPYVRGDTRVTMAGTERSEAATPSRPQKAGPSTDWSLQPDSMKLDSLVIAHQPWRGEYVPGPCTHQLGLSRNKVAVPEGAAGTPPFWRGAWRRT